MKRAPFNVVQRCCKSLLKNNPALFYKAMKIKAGLKNNSSIAAGYDIQSLREHNLSLDYSFADHTKKMHNIYVAPPTLAEDVKENF